MSKDEKPNNEGFPVEDTGEPTSTNTDELHRPEALEGYNSSTDFSTSDEALQTLEEYAHRLGTEPRDIDTEYREQRWWMFGTGSLKAGISFILTLQDRELINARPDGPFDQTIDIDGEYLAEAEFFGEDTTGENAILKQINRALEGAGLSEDEGISDLFDSDRIQAVSDESGMGRDSKNLPPSIVPHPNDIIPLVDFLTPSHAMDSLGFVTCGGGSATGMPAIMDILFRQGPLRPSTEARHYHQLFVQTETSVGNQELLSFNGIRTDTNTQQAEALEIIDNLRVDGFLGTVYLTNKAYMAVSRSVNESRMDTEDVEDHVGSLDEEIDWDKIENAVTGNRVIAGNADSVAFNDMIRWVMCWEQFLRSKPSNNEFLTYNGDHDRADHVDRALGGKTLVPAVFSITSPEDIENRHPDAPRPRTLEDCVSAGVKFLPRTSLGPINTEMVSGGTVAVGVAESQPLTQADIHNYIREPLSAELDIPVETANGIAVNDFSKYTMPGGASWIDFYGLFEVENHVETFERL
jgi:hypothetical protein